MSILRLIIILLVIHITPTALAQQQLHDIIHLDDGTVILGTIVGSLRGESIRIITDDGGMRIYKTYRVVKITPAPQPYLAKSPSAALAMSCVLPGLGQFYNEDTGMGFVFLGLDIVSFATIVGGNNINRSNEKKGYYYSSEGDEFIAMGVTLLFVSWGLSMLEAYTSAEKINRQQYLSPSALNLQPINTPDGFGARLAFGF